MDISQVLTAQFFFLEFDSYTSTCLHESILSESVDTN